MEARKIETKEAPISYSARARNKAYGRVREEYETFNVYRVKFSANVAYDVIVKKCGTDSRTGEYVVVYEILGGAMKGFVGKLTGSKFSVRAKLEKTGLFFHRIRKQAYQGYSRVNLEYVKNYRVA